MHSHTHGWLHPGAQAKEADAAARMEAQALMSPGAKGPAAAPPPAPPAGVAKLLNVKV